MRGVLADHRHEKTISLLAISISHLESPDGVQLELPLGLAGDGRRPGTKQGLARSRADQAIDAIRKPDVLCWIYGRAGERLRRVVRENVLHTASVPMPPRIILDYPRTHTLRQLARRGRMLAGRALRLLGLLGWLAAVPVSLWLALDWFGDQAAMEDPRSGVLAVGWVAGALVVPLILRIAGGWLAAERDPTRLVLFLRRFRFAHATDAVTFAIANTLGSTWRLVTLDDDSVEPLGVSAAVTVPLRLAHGLHVAGQFIFKTLGIAWRMLVWYCAIVVLGSALILLLELASERNFAPYRDIAERLSSGGDLAALVRPDRAGALAALLVPAAAVAPRAAPYVTAVIAAAEAAEPKSDQAVFVLWAGIIGAMFVLLFAWDELATVRSRLDQIARTETVRIDSAASVVSTVEWVWAASAMRWGATLTIAEVDDAVWREAVTVFAGHSVATIVDVSEPTEHLFWEIDALRKEGRVCVFVGLHQRIGDLVDPSASRGDDARRRLALLLESKPILAYTTDRRGLRRFARALRNILHSALEHRLEQDRFAPVSGRRRGPSAV